MNEVRIRIDLDIRVAADAPYGVPEVIEGEIRPMLRNFVATLEKAPHTSVEDWDVEQVEESLANRMA